MQDRDRARRSWTPMRAMFVVYLTLIVSGIVFFAVIGLTHN
jgi:hypothetical protein